MGSDNGGSLGIKAICLVVLTIMTTITPLATRYVRIRTDVELFIVSVAVVMTETVKIIICISMVIYSEGSIQGFGEEIKAAIVDKPKVTLQALIPGALYSLQNFLYTIALTNLDPVIFCITYQLKILTTALFSVLMLGKELRRLQYLSLFLLVIGVALVEMESEGGDSGGGETKSREQSPWLGMISVLTMCCSSGFAGVYMEKMFKESSSSVWVENIRLQTWQIPIVTITMVIKDWTQIQRDGFFVGFDWIVIALTITGGVSGLVIALTMKYAGNIPKTYAQCLAIIFTAVGSVIWFDLEATPLFMLGCVIVAVAIGFYNKRPSGTESGGKQLLPDSIRHVDLRKAYDYENMIKLDGGRNSAQG